MQLELAPPGGWQDTFNQRGGFKSLVTKKCRYRICGWLYLKSVKSNDEGDDVYCGWVLVDQHLCWIVEMNNSLDWTHGQIFNLHCPSSLCVIQRFCVCLCFCRSSRTVLQPDMVPESSAGPHVHSSDWLRQRPLHSALGQEETLHPGSVYRHTDRSGSVSEWITDRSVCILFVLGSFCFVVPCWRLSDLVKPTYVAVCFVHALTLSLHQWRSWTVTSSMLLQGQTHPVQTNKWINCQSTLADINLMLTPSI